MRIRHDNIDASGLAHAFVARDARQRLVSGERQQDGVHPAFLVLDREQVVVGAQLTDVV